MKFLVFSDVHFANKAPIHRVDENYSQTLLNKLEEVYKLAEENNCEHVLFLGDLYDSHRIYSYDLINEIIKIINKSGLITYQLIGQHDLVGYNKDTYLTSALCFTERYCKNLKTISEPIRLSDMIIKPCHSYDDFDTIIKEKTDTTYFNILLAHKLITEKKTVYQTYIIPEFCPCGYDLIMFGDLHTGMERVEYMNTTVWSPGALVRKNINECDRQIKVGVVEVKNKKVDIKEILLKSAKPSEEVFQVRHIEQVRKNTQNVNNERFINKILEIERESLDIYDLLEKVAKERGLKKEVINFILSKKS